MTTSQSRATELVVPTFDSLRALKAEILQLAAAHGASNVRVFGSVARATAGLTSDIDLLVDFEPGRTLLDHVGLWRDLEALLGRSVDVVSAGGLTDRDDDIRADAGAVSQTGGPRTTDKIVGDLLDAASAAAEIVARGQEAWEKRSASTARR